MIRIKKLRTHLQLDADLCQSFQKKVNKKFSPLISGNRAAYWTRLNLPKEEGVSWVVRETCLASETLCAGDLILSDQHTILFYRIPQKDGIIEAGVITAKETDGLSDFATFLSDTIERLVPGQKVSWEAVDTVGPNFALITTDATSVAPSAKDAEVAGILEQNQAKRLLEKIREVESSSITKIISEKELPSAKPILDGFEKMGLITKDFIVLCRKTGQQILKVSSRSAIEETSQKAFKCFICGNPISQENIDEIITCSDFGKKMLKDDYWLLVRVMSILEKMGIKNNEIAIRFGENRSMDVFLNLNDEIYMFNLNNKCIYLDDTYCIGATIAAFQVSHTIVVCTEKIPTIMKSHLERINPGKTIGFVDPIQNLEVKLLVILRERQKAHLLSLLEEFNSLTPVKVHELVLRRVTPEVAAPAERTSEMPEEKALEIEEAPAEPSAAPVVAEEELKEEPVVGMMPEIQMEGEPEGEPKGAQGEAPEDMLMMEEVFPTEEISLDEGFPVEEK